MTDIVRITAVIDHLLTAEVRGALAAAGLAHYYLRPTRSAHLQERRGVAGLLSQGLRLGDAPTDLYTLFVPAAEELAVLDLLAGHGRLAQPGMGSVYSEPVTLARGYPALLPVPALTPVTRPEHEFYPALVGINCVVQRGRGDRIAREVLELGASVPTVGFGTGKGLRDRLGLLRVTIPAEKELVSLVDSRQDADEVIEHIIRAGRLDLPGQGFIVSYPVSRGLINTRLTHGQVGQAASVDRIVAALDSLTGGVEWRSAAGARPLRTHRRFLAGTELTLIAPEDRVDELFRRAMAAGVQGATLASVRLQAGRDQPGLLKARAACAMFLADPQVPGVLAALEAAGAFGEEIQAVVYGRRVERAFTYLAEPARRAGA